MDIKQIRQAEQEIDGVAKSARELRHHALKPGDAANPDLIAATEELEIAASELRTALQRLRMSFQ